MLYSCSTMELALVAQCRWASPWGMSVGYLTPPVSSEVVLDTEDVFPCLLSSGHLWVRA